MSASDDDGPRPRGKVSRRSFLVLAGALTLGSCALPPLGSEPAAKTRRLIGPPTRWGEDDENLLWTELDAAGEARVMMWTPASKAEARDIEAFYRAASQVDWDSVVIADVPKPGDDEEEPEVPRGPKPRRFEFRSGNSAKFWEILRHGDSYTITFGRIGTKGQSQTKTFDTSGHPDSAVQAYGAERLAHEAVFKLIAEKLAKGYVEVGGLPPVVGSDWSRPETWQRVREKIGVRAPQWGKPTPLPTEAEMDAFEAAHGFKLPPSYRAFLRVFGPGDVNFKFRVAAPGGPEHYNLEAMVQEARQRVEDHEYDFASDEYVELEPVTRMIVFCEWDADRWGWDPDEPREGGEYAVRCWGRSYRVAEVDSESFPGFVVDKLFHGGLGSWVAEDGPGFEPATGRKGKTSKKLAAKPKAEAAAKPKRRSAQEENGHLRRIASDPADEGARLAYADWLDRYKDPTADLIRVRVERSKLPASDPGLGAIDARESKLKGKLSKKKGNELLAVGLLPWVLSRLGARIRLNDAGELYHIDIKEYQINAGALREFAVLPALRELELNDHPLTAEELDAVGRLASLRELHLHGVGIDDDGFQRLGRLENLNYLCLMQPETRGPGLARLKGLPKLETLILSIEDGARLPAHLAALAKWPPLRGLFLSGPDLRGKALAGLERLERLERLGLDDTPVGDDDLARVAGLVSLKFLDLKGTRVTGAGMKHLRGLRALEVFRTKDMTEADAAAPWLGRLTNLRTLELAGDFEHKRLTDAGLAHLAGLTRLTELDVSEHLLTDAGLVHLAGLTELEVLNLSDNEGIVGPGLEHLKHLPKLRRLDLGSTGLTTAAVPLLRQFSQLESLDLFGTKIGERGLNTLRNALPGTRN